MSATIAPTDVLDIFNRLGAVLASEPDLEGAVQIVVDVAVALTGAEFGALFYDGPGADGARVQEKVEELVSGSESFLLGPNTTLNSFLPLDTDLTGPKIGLISHSGHQGRHPRHQRTGLEYR